jgi:hypothetical protein
LSEVQELARAHTAENLEGLMEIARNPKSPAQARVAVLDRAWGKPGQSNDTQGRLTAGHSKPNRQFTYLPRQFLSLSQGYVGPQIKCNNPALKREGFLATGFKR